MIRYVGILDGKGRNWGVTLPDIAGCVGAGATPDEAIESATIALREVAAHRRSGGFALPHPSSLETILKLEECGTNPTLVMIPLLLDSGRTVRANLTFDAGLLDAIDKAAALRGLTRSSFLASAAREKIEASA